MTLGQPTLRTVSRIGRALLPDPLWLLVTSIRARRHSHRLNESWGVRALSDRLLGLLGPAVRTGPFAGLLLPEEAAPEHLGPYLLGTYEHELHGVWDALTTANVSLVVDVGAKFGYYAVGLARLLRVPAVAFDPDPWARRLTRRAAHLNKVNVTLFSRCTRGWLAGLAPGALVLIDCEGCEVALLARPVPAALTRCTLVIEIHEDVIPGAGCLLRETLAMTHDVTAIASDPAPPPVNVDLSSLSERERTLARTELRAPQSWLVCRLPGRPTADSPC